MTNQIDAAKKRLEEGRYLAWGYAGGPNECKHGYAAGVGCRQCDEELVRARTEGAPQ